jgi:YesN/AraC family two-component response regulator
MNKKNIILIDDDTVVRDMIKDSLEKDYNVIEASTYTDVMNLLDNSIDLALIDYVLPDADGFDVLQTLRASKPSLPAIMMTGYGNETVVIKALRTEIVDYMKKPLKLSYLKKRLYEILGGNQNNKQYESVTSREDFILDGVVSHIEEKYMKHITLEKAASMACMNKFKFCRAFKERYGQTFITYLNGIRVKNAADLLRNDNLSITEIAYFVGYGSVVHFDRVFRSTYGISPREYRKTITNSSPQS